MSQEHIGTDTITRQANADLREYEHYATRLIAGGKIDIANSQGAYTPGFLKNKPNTDEAATIAISGTVRAIANGVITEGGEVTVASDGKIETAAASDYVIGRALEAAAADNDVIEILLISGHFKPA